MCVGVSVVSLGGLPYLQVECSESSMFHLSRKELGKGDIVVANPRQSGSWGPLP